MAYMLEIQRFLELFFSIKSCFPFGGFSTLDLKIGSTSGFSLFLTREIYNDLISKLEFHKENFSEPFG